MEIVSLKRILAAVVFVCLGGAKLANGSWDDLPKELPKLPPALEGWKPDWGTDSWSQGLNSPSPASALPPSDSESALSPSDSESALSPAASESPLSGPTPSSSASAWASAHATFYGGDDASGTMGGACGFGDLYETGYGTETAALSTALFNDGEMCGACFQIKCDFASGGYSTKWCNSNSPSITVTGTNLCPPNPNRVTDGWCNPPRVHFDLAYPAFAQLADKTAGIIPIQYRRVSCSKPGGIKFCITGNKWFNLVLVFNVAGGGNVVQMDIKGGQDSEWDPMTRNWGQIWDSRKTLEGSSLSFRVTLGSGESLTIADLTDNTWQHGSTYSCTQNFVNT